MCRLWQPPQDRYVMSGARAQSFTCLQPSALTVCANASTSCVLSRLFLSGLSPLHLHEHPKLPQVPDRPTPRGACQGSVALGLADAPSLGPSSRVHRLCSRQAHHLCLCTPPQLVHSGMCNPHSVWSRYHGLGGSSPRSVLTLADCRRQSCSMPAFCECSCVL